MTGTQLSTQTAGPQAREGAAGRQRGSSLKRKAGQEAQGLEEEGGKGPGACGHGLTDTGTAWGSAACPCCYGSGGTRSPGGRGVEASGTARSCSCPAQSWCLKNRSPHVNGYTHAHSTCARSSPSHTAKRTHTHPSVRPQREEAAQRSIRTEAQCSAMKRNQAQTQATVCVNLKHVVLRARGYTPKATYV